MSIPATLDKPLGVRGIERTIGSHDPSLRAQSDQGAVHCSPTRPDPSLHSATPKQGKDAEIAHRLGDLAELGSIQLDGCLEIASVRPGVVRVPEPPSPSITQKGLPLRNVSGKARRLTAPGRTHPLSP